MTGALQAVRGMGTWAVALRWAAGMRELHVSSARVQAQAHGGACALHAARVGHASRITSGRVVAFSEGCMGIRAWHGATPHIARCAQECCVLG